MYDECYGIWKKVLFIIFMFFCSLMFVGCCDNIVLVVIGKIVVLEVMLFDLSKSEWRKLEIVFSEFLFECFLNRFVFGLNYLFLFCVG